MLASKPTCLGVVEYAGEFSWLRARKTPMTIIQKYRYGLSEPGAGKDQINGVISVNVTRFDAPLVLLSTAEIHSTNNETQRSWLRAARQVSRDIIRMTN